MVKKPFETVEVDGKKYKYDRYVKPIYEREGPLKWEELCASGMLVESKNPYTLEWKKCKIGTE